MVGSEQVIIYSLWYADNAAIIPDHLHISAYLIAGVHGIVAAVIEKVPYIVLFEYLEYSLIVAVINGGIRHFISARSQLR